MTLKKQKKVILLLLIFIGSMSLMPVSNVRAEHTEKDPRGDLYSISLLNFFLTIGENIDEMDNLPELDTFRSLINDLISRSTPIDRPNYVDIKEFEIMTSDPDANAILIEFYGNPRNADNLKIFGVGKARGNLFSFNIDTDGSSTAPCQYTSEATGNTTDTTDTTAWISDNTIGFAFYKNEFDYQDGDSLLIVSLISDGNMDNPLGVNVIFDVAPNEDFSGLTTYHGDEPITTFLDEISSIFFGWMTGRLSFMFFILLLILAGQILFDRKLKYLHWFGFGFLIFLLYPILFYTISIPYATSIMIDIIAIIDIMTIISLGFFIIMSLLNGFMLLKKYRYMMTIGLILMSIQAFINLFLFNTGEIGIINLIVIGISTISIPIILRESKRLGRN